MTSSASRSLTGTPPSATGIVAIGGLAMQGLGVIDRGRDALRLQRGRQRVPPPRREPDGVLRPDRCRLIADVRHRREAGEALGIALRHGVPR